MTLAPTDETIRHENCAKKTEYGKNKASQSRRSLEMYLQRCVVRVGEREERTYGPDVFCLIYRTSSVNGCTLRILSRSVLVPC
jgi:hypothetical protein